MKNEIKSLPVELFKPKACIYHLVKDNEVVYVGQTTNLLQRLAAHIRDKQFDAVNYREVPFDDLDAEEFADIIKHQPRLNSPIVRKNCGLVSVAGFRRSCGTKLGQALIEKQLQLKEIVPTVLLGKPLYQEADVCAVVEELEGRA